MFGKGLKTYIAQITTILRLGLFVLLACLLFISTIHFVPKQTAEQPTLVATAWVNLVQAFESVQEADKLGAPSNQIAVLSTELNTALEYYNNATQLSDKGDVNGARTYSSLSINESTIIQSKALALQAEAKDQRTNEQAIAYGTASAASVVSALLVTEYYRIHNFLRKRKFLRMKIE